MAESQFTYGARYVQCCHCNLLRPRREVEEVFTTTKVGEGAVVETSSWACKDKLICAHLLSNQPLI